MSEEDAATEGVAVVLALAAGPLCDSVRAALSRDCAIVLVKSIDDADVAIHDRPVPLEVPTVALVDDAAIEVALAAGCAAGLPLAASTAQIRIAVAAAAHGLQCRAASALFSPLRSEASGGIETWPDDPYFDSDLTRRERQVLEQLIAGASNKVIARALGISVHTAKFHVASIIAKLGASGRTDAVARALRSAQPMI